jgi:hypothetical protein
LRATFEDHGVFTARVCTVAHGSRLRQCGAADCPVRGARPSALEVD